MRILGFLGIVMAGMGALMLVAPGVARFVMSYVLGMRSTPHAASRMAAWGLIVLGLAVTFLSRLI